MSSASTGPKNGINPARQGGPAGQASSPTAEYDPFIASDVFPEAPAIFASKIATLAEVRDTACVVLDTNALLVPYGIGSQTLAQIDRTYRKLANEKRLVVPAQAAREFAKHRVTKLAEIFQKLSRRRAQAQPFSHGTYPLLDGFDKYRQLQDVEKRLDQLLKEYHQLLSSVVDHVRSWEWNDPVSLLYRELFSKEVVVDTTRDRDRIATEHKRRYLHRIPPGYQDEPKDDGGIGDLLIWYTILDVGAAQKRSVLFVSGEEKSDWWHRIEHQPLYPRFELVDEFRRASEGNSFHIIKFSHLLDLFGADRNAVAEVQQEETRVAATAPSPPPTTRSQLLVRVDQAERAVAAWFMAQGYTVVPAPGRAGYDYDIDKGGLASGLEVVYATSRQELPARLHARAERYRRLPAGATITVVVVAESPDIFANVERQWASMGKPFILVTGTLDQQGQFELSGVFQQ